MSSDLELVERVKKGDKFAFKELVEQNKNNVYYLAIDMTSNREDAEDISQEVFIKAYKSLDSFRGDSKFSTWLYRITVNSCLSLRKKKSASRKVEDENMEDIINQKAAEKNISFVQNPERYTETGFIRISMEQAIEKLSPREKTVFVMRNYNGLHFGEISDALKLKLGTVRSLNFRALEKLRIELAYYKNSIPTEEVNG